MKLLSYRDPRRPTDGVRLGAVLPGFELALDLARAAELLEERPFAPFASLLDFLRGGPEARAEAERLVTLCAKERLREAEAPLAAIRFLAPIPRPTSLRDCMTFRGHVVGCARRIAARRFAPLAWADRLWGAATGGSFLAPPRAWFERPLYYHGNPGGAGGHGTVVEPPPGCREFDFELEYGVWIGKWGRRIPEHQAREHVAGFSIFNDFTARDFQRREGPCGLGPSRSKGFDGGSVIGPWLTTPDEVGWPPKLQMQALVNGVTWTIASSDAMQFSWETIVAAISQTETLEVGDFIASGTVPGGCGWEQGRLLRAGDVVELHVDRLGTLRNAVGPVGGPGHGGPGHGGSGHGGSGHGGSGHGGSGHGGPRAGSAPASSVR